VKERERLERRKRRERERRERIRVSLACEVQQREESGRKDVDINYRVNVTSAIIYIAGVYNLDETVVETKRNNRILLTVLLLERNKIYLR
jgi:hypothetical protein